MMQLIIIYVICGATWGLVFSIIGSQEGRFIINEVNKYPVNYNQKKAMLILMIVFCILFEVLFWPIDVPVMIYKMFKKSI